MNTNLRPVHLDLTRIKFPLVAIVSILHRISGVLLFLLLPLPLYLLHSSLQSREHFAQLHAFVAIPLVKFSLWILLSAVAFHFFAGLRHMAMDCGAGESLKAARVSALLILFLAIITSVWVGVWLW